MIKNRLSARWRFPLAILLIWLLCALALLFQAREMIANFDFRDPDDALRLVEVRDWMAGQNWFDVTQYRINPPTGGAMHWSRLIDVPRSEEHTSELQSLMRISYAVFCLKKN